MLEELLGFFFYSDSSYLLNSVSVLGVFNKKLSRVVDLSESLWSGKQLISYLLVSMSRHATDVEVCKELYRSHGRVTELAIYIVHSCKCMCTDCCILF